MGNTEKAINEAAEELSIQAISQADTGEPNTRVQIASKSKRKVMRPAYLKDFV